MKKILIVNCVFDPEPVVSAQIGKSLAFLLSRLGNSVTVIAPYPSRPYGFKFDKQILENNKKYTNPRIVYLDSFTYPQSGLIGRIKESFSFGLICYKHIKEAEQYDIIYMNTWPFFGQLGVALAARQKKTPYIVHVQDLYPESLTNRFPSFIKQFVNFCLIPIDRYIIKNSSKVIAISDSMKRLICSTRKISNEKIKVIINWQEEDVFKNYTENWLNTKLTFMYLGNIGPIAGLPFIIHAFGKSNIEAKLIIAGSGSMKEECIRISKIYKDANISFQDVAGGEVAKTQSKAHILLLPMIHGASITSIPSKLPAYMFSAKPILAIVDMESDTAEAIQKSKCGWVGKPGNENWLIRTFKEIEKIDMEALQKKGKKGLQYAKNNFSREKNLKSLGDVFISYYNDGENTKH